MILKFFFAAVAVILPVCSAQDDIDISLVLAASPPAIVSVPLDQVSNKPAELTATSAAPMPQDTTAVQGRSNDRLEARDGDCSAQHVGAGPVPNPDTVQAFQQSQVLQSMALQALTPDGYLNILTNSNAAVAASAYMGQFTLTSYNTSACAEKCNSAIGWGGCLGFNVYIERDPSQDPNAQNCPNPPSTINYRCTIWGAPLAPSQATNKGQWRDKFQVAIAGSNAYNAELALQPQADGYYGPVSFGNASINAPLNPPSYMGYQYFPFSQSQGFSVITCADYCGAQSRYNENHPASDCSYVPCTFFNAYILSKNGVPQGLYCAIYNNTWGPSYATNHAHYDQQGNNYTVSHSYGYTVDWNPPQPLYDPQCGAPFIKDPGFDAPDVNTFPYLAPYWNVSTVGSCHGIGGVGPGYDGSTYMFEAGFYTADHTASVTLSQRLTVIPQGNYTFGFYYKFQERMDVCQIEMRFPDTSYPRGGHGRVISLHGLTPNTWYEDAFDFSGGGNNTLSFVFSCPNATVNPSNSIYIDNIYIGPNWWY